MKADTFAKLIVLETLLEAEVGHFLERPPAAMELFREGMVARISDLVDAIDVLDAVAAARVYDAIVDFLAALPDDDPEGVVEAALRFRRAMDRIVARGMDSHDLRAASVWAVVLEELLEEMGHEYDAAVRMNGELQEREYFRALALLARAREAADRVLREAGSESAGMRNEMDRLSFAIRHQRLQPAEVGPQIRALQHRVARYRPSKLTTIGTFVLSQILRRDKSRRAAGAKRERSPKAGDKSRSPKGR